MQEINSEVDDNILDIDEVSGKDIKLNIDFYIHHGILKAQKALIKEDVKEGFLQYRVIVEHLEILCLAGSLINKEEFEKQINDFKEEKKYKEENDSLAKSVLIANKKMEIMLKEAVKSNITSEPLKV